MSNTIHINTCDSNLMLKNSGEESQATQGVSLDCGSTTSSTVCVVEVNTLTGGSEAEFDVQIQGSYDESDWTTVAGMLVDQQGKYNLALGGHDYRYWRYVSNYEGDGTSAVWSAHLAAS